MPNSLSTFLSSNKVLLLGLAASIGTVVSQFVQSGPVNYPVMAWAIVVAAIGFLANNLHGQVATILSSLLPTIGVIYESTKDNTAISWAHIAALAAVAVIGAITGPAKPNSTLRAIFIILLVSFGALKKSSAQSFKMPPKEYYDGYKVVYVDHMPIGDFVVPPHRKQSYYTGFRFFFNHKPDPSHLHQMSRELSAPPTGADTTVYKGFQPVVSVVLEAYSPVTHTWTVLGGTGINYEHDTWKKSPNSSGNWYTDYAFGLLVYAGGPLGANPTPPSSPHGVGAAGLTASVLNKYLTAGWAYDFIGKGPLYTVGSSFSIF